MVSGFCFLIAGKTTWLLPPLLLRVSLWLDTCWTPSQRIPAASTEVFVQGQAPEAFAQGPKGTMRLSGAAAVSWGSCLFLFKWLGDLGLQKGSFKQPKKLPATPQPLPCHGTRPPSRAPSEPGWVASLGKTGHRSWIQTRPLESGGLKGLWGWSPVISDHHWLPFSCVFFWFYEQCVLCLSYCRAGLCDFVRFMHVWSFSKGASGMFVL